MKREELTETFMMILNLKKTVVLLVYTQIFQRFKGYSYRCLSLTTIKYFCIHYGEERDFFNLRPS